MAEITQKRLRTDEAGAASIVLQIGTDNGGAKLQLPLGAAPQSQFDKDRKFREALRSVADALASYVGGNPALEAEAKEPKEKKDKAAKGERGEKKDKAARAAKREAKKERA